jgi:hypothetical protein
VRGLKPLPLPSWATSARVWCGARGSNSPGSACKAGVLARGLAPRKGSGGGTRTPVSALQRRASWPLDYSGSRVAADGIEPSRPGLWGPASSRERSGSGGRIRTDGLLVMSQASCLCSSPQRGGDKRCEDIGARRHPVRGCSPHGIRRTTMRSTRDEETKRSFRNAAGFEPALAFAITDVVPSVFDQSGGRESHPDPRAGDPRFCC